MRGVRIIGLILLAAGFVAAVMYALGYKHFVLDAVTWAPSARAHTHDWAQLSPQQRQWFRQQRKPDTYALCCSEPDVGSDAEIVEEDIRNGEYWVRSPTTRGEWIKVPAHAVLTEPNKFGRPVVWWRWQDGHPVAFCYSPGGGT